MLLSISKARIASDPLGRACAHPLLTHSPVVYRLYEVLLVYGHAIKAQIHEKFGDGIMSAIDFT